MKGSILTLLLTSVVLAAAPQDYVNFLRQTQLDNYVDWDIAIDPTGTMLSPREIGDLGSIYQLWAVHGPTGKEITIDREFVSEYSPKITIAIETGDPYKFHPRTRIDQPVTVRVTTSDLITSGTDSTGKQVPPIARKVHFAHKGYPYPENGYRIDNGENLEPQFSDEYTIDKNGSLVLEFPSSNLTGDNLTKVQGLEIFTISSFLNNNGHGNNADDVDSSNQGNKDVVDLSGSIDDETFGGGDYVVGAIMEKAQLQVWPVAEASISGIDPSQSYDDIPPITVTLADLYPDSTTYVRIYKGAPTSAPSDPIEVGSACAIIRDSIPQDRTLYIEDLAELISKTGSYTLEVLHETPFGTDVLTQFHPLQVQWQISFHGTLYSKQ